MIGKNSFELYSDVFIDNIFCCILKIGTKANFPKLKRRSTPAEFANVLYFLKKIAGICPLFKN